MNPSSEYLLSILMTDAADAHERLSNVLRRRAPFVVSTNTTYGEAIDAVRITVVVRGNDAEVANLIRQIEKMVDVWEVQRVEDELAMTAQMAWYRLPDLEEVRNLLRAFGGRLMHVDGGQLLVQMMDRAGELDRFEALVQRFGDFRSVRTGTVAALV